MAERTGLLAQGSQGLDPRDGAEIVRVLLAISGERLRGADRRLLVHVRAHEQRRQHVGIGRVHVHAIAEIRVRDVPAEVLT